MSTCLGTNTVVVKRVDGSIKKSLLMSTPVRSPIYCTVAFSCPMYCTPQVAQTQKGNNCTSTNVYSQSLHLSFCCKTVIHFRSTHAPIITYMYNHGLYGDMESVGLAELKSRDLPLHLLINKQKIMMMCRT